MRAYLFIAACGIVYLFGHNELAQAQDARAQQVFNQANAECHARSARHEFKSAVETETCYVNASETYMRTVGFPWMDLQYRNGAEHLKIAAAFDAGRITVQQLQIEMDAADARMNETIDEGLAQFQQSQAEKSAQAEADRRDALMRMSQGLLGPTRSGGFGEKSWQWSLVPQPGYLLNRRHQCT